MLLLLSSCGTVIGDPDELVSEFSAAAAWRWQNTREFTFRGRARLQGENQVFSGPFLLTASRSAGRIRADFCGPDGSPLLSVYQDSTGFLSYSPDDGNAFFCPGGLPVNGGYLGVNAVISILRTGFPAEPVPWQMAETFDTVPEGTAVEWRFDSGGTDSLMVILEPGDLFPSLESGDTRLDATGSSWHEAFSAWPMEWMLSSPSLGVVIRLRSIDTDTAPASSMELLVPVPVDTIRVTGGEWTFSRWLPVR